MILPRRQRRRSLEALEDRRLLFLGQCGVFGDANLDGQVDLNDHGIFRTEFGLAGPEDLFGSDFDCDGDVDITDVNTLRNNFLRADDGTPNPIGVESNRLMLEYNAADGNYYISNPADGNGEVSFTGYTVLDTLGRASKAQWDRIRDNTAQLGAGAGTFAEVVDSPFGVTEIALLQSAVLADGQSISIGNPLPTVDPADLSNVHLLFVRTGETDAEGDRAISNPTNAPLGPVTDNDSVVDSVAESAAIGTPVGVTASAVDPDVADTVSYGLDDNAGGRFAIDPTTGVVTVAGALDFETSTSHAIVVRATSTDGTSSTANFTIAVMDVDEHEITPIVDNDPAVDQVAEESLLGATVGITAFADDADGTDTVSYSLDDNAGGRFAIDPATGVVTVAGPLDFETATSHQIVVRATSTDGSASIASYTIAIGDVTESAIQIIDDPLRGERILQIVGTDGDDSINLRPTGNPNVVRVVLNGVVTNVIVRGTLSPPVARFVVYGGAGNDTLRVLEVPEMQGVPAELHGGAGNDALRGGAGHDLILGGDGDDVLYGGAGRDLMVGGLGADQVRGAADDDLLIGGIIDFDEDIPALDALLAEWTSARSYEERIANLRGAGVGPAFAARLNGNTFLLNEGSGANVHDDNARDELWGGANDDWLFANVLRDAGDRAQTRDRIWDLSEFEFTQDLDYPG